MGAPKIFELQPQALEGASLIDEAFLGIGVGEDLTAHQLVQLARRHGIQHIVQRSGLQFDQEIKAARLLLEKPHKFFSHPLSAICGSAKFFEGRHFASSFAAGSSKEGALEDAAAFLDEQSATRRISEKVLLATDEFFTNANRNAWIKKEFTTDQPQDFSAPVERPGRIEIFAHADAERLILGCRDTFGLLEIPQILNRLDACLVNGVSESIRRGPGGAGIGSYLVFESGISYYAGVHRNQTTVVCVAFALGSNAKADHELSKNLHLISL